jgi:tRNA dimethylallyltransferase
MVAGEGRPKIVVICGPTGVGKTAATIALGLRLGGEVVNADSMQVYRRMDIGTAKPTPEERAALPHHLIDLVEPDEPFDAARYARLAEAAILEIAGRGRLPLVVGGTGLYLKALMHGLFDAEPPDPGRRRRLEAQADRLGSPALHDRLRSVDPETAARLHPNDRCRIIRALEVLEATGRSMGAHHRSHRFATRRFDALKIGLHLPRPQLYARIDRRACSMIDAGLREETEALLAMGYHGGLKPMQALGYRHMLALIAQRSTLPQALALLQRDTRRYAKRQMTWFRADPEIRWFDPGAHDALFGTISALLKERP